MGEDKEILRFRSNFGNEPANRFKKELFPRTFPKGQLISKADCQAEDFPKKRTKEFVFTSMRRVFVRFFGRILCQKTNVSRFTDL